MVRLIPGQRNLEHGRGTENITYKKALGPHIFQEKKGNRTQTKVGKRTRDKAPLKVSYRGLAFKMEGCNKLGYVGIRAVSGGIRTSIQDKVGGRGKDPIILVEDMKLLWTARYVPKEVSNSSDLGTL